MILERGTACCALALALVFGGSGSEAAAKLSEGSHQLAYAAGLGDRQLAAVTVSPRPRTSPAACPGTTARVGSDSVAYAAVVKHIAVIHTRPQGRSPVIRRFDRLNQNGFHEVLAIVGVHRGARCRPDWYRVELPVLPNGTSGWVRTWAVASYRVRSRIEIDISEKVLRLYRAGTLAFESRIAVGTAATPTPLGRYYVNERYVLPDARGPFGPYALGISAHSDVLQHVWVEDGPIGIHGTNQPWTVGQAASHGCIRLPNTAMRRLFPLAPAGTPVNVKA